MKNEEEDVASLAQIVEAQREAEALGAELAATSELKAAVRRLTERFFMKCALQAATPPSEVKKLAAIVLLGAGAGLLEDGYTKEEAKATLARLAEAL